MKKKRWMNDKTTGELKKTRGFLNRMVLSTVALFLVFMTIFLYTWCFTTDVLVPFVSMFMSILAAVLLTAYVMKRDICSILIFLKDAIETEVNTEKKP